jgi:hypothetical protein
MATRTYKTTKDITVIGTKPRVSLNDRTHLARDFGRYWLGVEDSNIGEQYLHFKGGRVFTRSFCFERRDIAIVQFQDVANVFIEPDGQLQVDLFDVVVSDAEVEYMKGYAKGWYQDENNQAYIQRHHAFFREKPWEQVSGMTVAEALDKFAELGWFSREDREFVDEAVARRGAYV